MCVCMLWDIKESGYAPGSHELDDVVREEKWCYVSGVWVHWWRGTCDATRFLNPTQLPKAEKASHAIKKFNVTFSVPHNYSFCSLKRKSHCKLPNYQTQLWGLLKIMQWDSHNLKSILFNFMLAWWGQWFCLRMSKLHWSSWGTSLAVRWRIASLWWWYCCRCRTQLYIHPAQATLLSERTCRKQKSSGCTQPAVPCLGTGCGTRHHLRHYLL